MIFAQVYVGMWLLTVIIGTVINLFEKATIREGVKDFISLLVLVSLGYALHAGGFW